MADDRLQRTHALGQSIWYDNMRRGLLRSGALADAGRAGRSRHDVQPDHLREGDRLLRRLRGRAAQAGRRRALDDRDLRDAGDRGHPRRLRPACCRCSRRAAASTGASRWRCCPSWRPRPTRPISEGLRLAAEVGRPNVMIKVPATPEGIPAIRALTAHGRQRQRDADLLAAAVRRGGRGVPGGARGARRSRRLARRARVGGQLLRVARRQRLRQAAQGQGHGRCRARAARCEALLGKLGDRQRQDGVRDLRAHDRVAALEQAGGGRRAPAAPAVGVDRHQGPALPRHLLRRRADRAPTPSTRFRPRRWTPTSITASPRRALSDDLEGAKRGGGRVRGARASTCRASATACWPTASRRSRRR